MSTLDVRSFTVGMVQENSYIVRADSQARRAVIVDPGDEPERLLAAVKSLNVTLEAILLTHCHFDHIGAVAPVAAATGAPVYCPVIEQPILADVMRWVPPGFGPFESYEADHTLAGGERLSLAGMDFESAWRVSSWDGFHIPKPFSRINMRFETVRMEARGDRDEAARQLGRRLAELNPDRSQPSVRKRA